MDTSRAIMDTSIAIMDTSRAIMDTSIAWRMQCSDVIVYPKRSK
jgi:hypothetical protein